MLHSFSVPVWRIKQDAIPGRSITGWFQPTKTGRFDVQCAEICGFGHGVMAAKVLVESPEETRRLGRGKHASGPVAMKTRMWRTENDG